MLVQEESSWALNANVVFSIVVGILTLARACCLVSSGFRVLGAPSTSLVPEAVVGDAPALIVRPLLVLEASVLTGV